MGLDDLLQRLLDESRADSGRDARRRRRMLQALAEETATLRGTLIDLAERETGVIVRTLDGRNHRGRIRVVGSDFVVVATDAGDTWVPLVALELVRLAPGVRAGSATGDRSVLDLELGEALGRVAPNHPEVAVQTVSGEPLIGRLRSVGADVVTLELNGSARQPCYLRLASLLSVVFLSG
jgi:hypothetical protein